MEAGLTEELACIPAADAGKRGTFVPRANKERTLGSGTVCGSTILWPAEAGTPTAARQGVCPYGDETVPPRTLDLNSLCGRTALSCTMCEFDPIARNDERRICSRAAEASMAMFCPGRVRIIHSFVEFLGLSRSATRQMDESAAGHKRVSFHFFQFRRTE